MAYDPGSANDRRRLGRHQGRVRSQLVGAASTRKLLRQLPASVKDEMADILAEEAPHLLAAMKADAPVKSGALRAGLAAKLLRKSMRLRVGIVTAASSRKLFYGRIIELGRKANTKSRGGAIAARPFVFKPRPAIRARLASNLRSLWEHALAHAAIGVGDD